MEKAVLLSFIFYGNLTLKQKIKVKSGFLFYYYTYLNYKLLLQK